MVIEVMREINRSGLRDLPSGQFVVDENKNLVILSNDDGIEYIKLVDGYSKEEYYQVYKSCIAYERIFAKSFISEDEFNKYPDHSYHYHYTVDEAIFEFSKVVSPEDLVKFVTIVNNFNVASNQIFGNDINIIVIGKRFHHYLNIVFKIPSFTIKNSNGQEHQIHGLYVFISIDIKRSNSHSVYNLYGLRTDLTAREANSVYGYSHSHLSGGLNYDLSWRSFCTGTSVMSQQMHFPNDFTSLTRTKFFVNILKSYLEWESLEGGPYKKIEEIGTGDLKSMMGKDTERIKDFMFYSSYSMKFRYSVDKFDLIENDALHDNLLQCISDNDAICDHVVCYKSEYGKVYNKVGKPSFPSNIHGFRFNGEYVNVSTIDEDVNEAEDNRKKYCHPAIIKTFKTKVNEKINDIFIEQDSVHRAIAYATKYGFC